jgi:peptidoglycan-N-acetylglucosamine deacetylase
VDCNPQLIFTPMDRILNLKTLLHLFAVFFALFPIASPSIGQGIISLSFDDPSTTSSPGMTWQERNERILQTLAQYQLNAMLFVCRKRVDSPEGHALIQSWDDAGHAIANHSDTHPYMGSARFTAQAFERELLRCDSLIAGYNHFVKRFRFPFLKEGSTMLQRDSMRAILGQYGYQNGHVSIDASDWYMDQQLMDSLQKNPSLDPQPYGDYYIAHILDRAHYYDSLATSLTGRKVKHVLLLHHNLLNALFLEDLIQALTAQGWTFQNTSEVYQDDDIYLEAPNISPAGESLIWALAKESGKYEKILRYPAEDGEYERERLKEWLKAP